MTVLLRQSVLVHLRQVRTSGLREKGDQSVPRWQRAEQGSEKGTADPTPSTTTRSLLGGTFWEGGWGG